MWWVVAWALVAVTGVAGTAASLNSIRFRNRVDREGREMPESAAAQPALRLDRLPAPVRRYLAKAIGDDMRPVRRARLEHGGSFRTSLNGSWLPIRGQQSFTADPPGFVWWGRVRLAPGVWIDARDRSVGGVGNMWVTIESTITIANSVGPQLDQGALLRLLGELTWLPTALADERYVAWTAVDDRRARATLTVNGHSVSGDFEFGADDLPAQYAADRYRDLGGGKAVMTRFVGTTSDFRRVDGLLVPHRVAGAWVIDGTPIEYARFDIDRIAIVR